MEFSIRVVFGTVLRTQVGLYSRGIEWIYAANSWWRNESNSHSCRMMIHDDLRMRGSYLIASDLNINYQSSFCESFPHFYQLVGEFKVESIIGWTSLKPSQTIFFFGNGSTMWTWSDSFRPSQALAPRARCVGERCAAARIGCCDMRRRRRQLGDAERRLEVWDDIGCFRAHFLFFLTKARSGTKYIKILFIEYSEINHL